MKKVASVAAVLLMFGAGPWRVRLPPVGTDGSVIQSALPKGQMPPMPSVRRSALRVVKSLCWSPTKTQKVVPIDNPSAVTGHEGQHVKVTGSLTSSGAVHIDKVTPTGGN